MATCAKVPWALTLFLPTLFFLGRPKGKDGGGGGERKRGIIMRQSFSWPLFFLPPHATTNFPPHAPLPNCCFLEWCQVNERLPFKVFFPRRPRRKSSSRENLGLFLAGVFGRCCYSQDAIFFSFWHGSFPRVGAQALFFFRIPPPTNPTILTRKLWDKERWALPEWVIDCLWSSLHETQTFPLKVFIKL